MAGKTHEQVIAELKQQYQSIYNSGNKQAVFDLTQGSNEDVKEAARSVYEEGNQNELYTAGKSIFGENWNSQMASEALGAYKTSGRDIDSFVSDFRRNPGVYGRSLSQGVATLDASYKNAQIQTAISPGSPLYNATFGTDPNKTGGIVGSEYEAFKGSLDPQQKQSQQKILDTLSARGLGTSGMVGAQLGQNSTDYSNILANALEKMMAQGKSNVLASATGGTTNPDYQSVGKQLAGEQSTREATAYDTAKKNASGWDWLLPVAQVAATVAGQPWLTAALGLGETAAQGTKKKTATNGNPYDEYGNLKTGTGDPSRNGAY